MPKPATADVWSQHKTLLITKHLIHTVEGQLRVWNVTSLPLQFGYESSKLSYRIAFSLESTAGGEELKEL